MTIRLPYLKLAPCFLPVLPHFCDNRVETCPDYVPGSPHAVARPRRRPESCAICLPGYLHAGGHRGAGAHRRRQLRGRRYVSDAAERRFFPAVQRLQCIRFTVLFEAWRSSVLVETFDGECFDGVLDEAFLRFVFVVWLCVACCLLFVLQGSS